MSTDAAQPRATPSLAAEPSDLALAGGKPREITSDQLLRGAREVVIHHAGRPYRLCLTARNKLILIA
jgi:hemin uptake protein HemP